MKLTSIADLPIQLKDVLTLVRAGEEVQLTDQGKAIAKVVPVFGSAEERPYPPFLIPPKRRLDVEAFFRRSRVQDPEGTVRTALLRERDEDR